MECVRFGSIPNMDLENFKFEKVLLLFEKRMQQLRERNDYATRKCAQGVGGVQLKQRELGHKVILLILRTLSE
jgi:hypothetical protein